MSKHLIAMVATAVMLNGVRTVIQPGEELPGLSEHDARELTASGAAENPADKAAVAKAEAAVAKEADAEFAAARGRVQQAQASTQPTEPLAASEEQAKAGHKPEALPEDRPAAKPATKPAPRK